MGSNANTAYLRRRITLGVIVAALAAVALAVASGSSHSASRPSGAAAGHGSTVPGTTTTVTPAGPPPPALLVKTAAHPGSGWQVVAYVHGQPAAWESQRGGVTLLRFDQSGLRLDLHAGSSDGGVGGWKYGDQISASEIHHVVAAFNGGFKFSYREVGFVSGGHVGAPLSAGLGSIVTYTNGTTNVGAWGAGVPSSRLTVYSVLQNERLLVDRGRVAANASSCVIECWGATINGVTSVARSGLGITATGQLVWAAGESLLPAQLGAALVSAGAVRAVELDINPFWVAGYLYLHRPNGPLPVPLVPGQVGIEGKLLTPDSRDFMTIVAR